MNLIDPQQLTEPDQLFREIERVLAYLRLMACSITEEDIRNPRLLDIFSSHIGWLKAHFERLESLEIGATR